MPPLPLPVRQPFIHFIWSTASPGLSTEKICRGRKTVSACSIPPDLPYVGKRTETRSQTVEDAFTLVAEMAPIDLFRFAICGRLD